MKRIDCFDELTKNELLDLITSYDEYVTEYYEEHTEGSPVCVAEYYDNEYQGKLKIGNKIYFGSTGVDDEDLQEWLDYTEKKIFVVKDIDTESELFWIEDCEYGISFNENWSKVTSKTEQIDNETFRILRENFESQINKEYGFNNIVDLVDDDKLLDHIIEFFADDFMYGEVFDLLCNELRDYQLKEVMELLGHDFVDLRELTDEEREKYY